jgi:putative ABC transport system ATP-binding protein
MFELIDVTYKDILTIDHLRLEKGRVTCIVGESGSGKTTLLRLLNKLICCDRGTTPTRGRTSRTWTRFSLCADRSSCCPEPAIYPATYATTWRSGWPLPKRPPASMTSVDRPGTGQSQQRS